MLFLSITLHAALAVGFVLAHFHQPDAPASLPANVRQPSLVLISSEIAPPGPQSLAPSRPAVSSVTPSLPRPESSVPVPTIVPHESLVTDAKSSSVSKAEANPNANLPLPRAEAILSPNPPPPLNSSEGVVFLLDVSGSMYEPYAGSTRLMLAREELAGQIRSLKNGAPFAVTVYAQSAHNSGPLVAAGDATREAAVRFIMQDFDCGGGTNLPAGLASAQELHPGHIVLVSDGDLNANESDLLADARRILGAPGHGSALSIVAICPRSSTNAEQLLQGLADQQNGSCAVEPPPTQTALLTAGKSEVASP
jgi:hypothetical protein